MTAKLAVHVSEEKQWKVNWKLMELFPPDSPPSTFCPATKVLGFLSPGNGGSEGGIKTIESR